MIKELSKTSEQDTVVGANVRVTGKLHTSSNIQINGHVKGEVSSDGSVVIGKTAIIDGPIAASDIRIEGVVKGNITASNSLELHSKAKVIGDIQTKILSIQSGATFVGKSIMEAEENIKGEATTKKESEPELDIGK
ncbi:MAG: polymer-forming cytoskeletal protein [Candidatus Berkelbacteria bacterium]|nr:polymer-forming cytoskeletal protein [Candidatus Berkelbacteria bacterium]